ncbi:MAG: hypothetical protein Q9219_003496 [cf. Caloplaca sp. 3 TL-2023]
MLLLPITLSLLLSIVRFGQAAAVPAPSLDAAAYPASSIIRRDVVVIGGGASGTYAAIGLRDKGKTVAVVEAQGQLGGHTNTYTDPVTSRTYDYGVAIYENTPTVTSFFARFNIPLTTGTGGNDASVSTYYVDLRTGKNVTGYAPADPSAAFGAYAAQLVKYPFLATPGWNLPDPVPADLLIPFGDFVKKYQLDAAAFTISDFSQGFGDILSIPSLYVLKFFSLAVLQGAQTGFLTTARHDNSELYGKARAELGADVLLNSKVIATNRSSSGVKVLVKSPQGLKLILAKKLIISIPPLLSNFNGFDLSTTERDLFGQFVNGAYYTGILRNTGISDDIAIKNVGANTAYNIPPLPAPYSINPTGIPGLHAFTFGATTALSDTTVKASVISSLQKLKAAGTIPPTTGSSTPDFAAYDNHTPYELRVSADAIKAGFYGRLNALQGVRSTWWTGAAFDKHSSADLWAFTAGLLERAVAG